MAVLRPEHAPTALTSLERRAELLGEAGADAVLALPFDRDVAAWSPQEFVDRVLVAGLHAAAVVVGANFRFGHRAAGDVAALRELGDERGFVAEGIELDGGPQVWSSTYVRTCLAAGDVDRRRGGPRPPVRRARGRGARRPARPRAGLPDRQRAHRRADRGPRRRRVRRVAAPAGHRRAATRPRSASAPTRPSTASAQRRVESYVLDRTDLELYGVEVEVSLRAAAARR